MEGSITKLKKRNKLIRIADKSEGGWKTVEEYLSDEVASDSEDEKRIRAADNRAVRKIKSVRKDGKVNRKRPTEAAGAHSQSVHNGGNFPYTAQPFRSVGAVATAPSNSKANDQCSRCSAYGYWDRDCRKKTNTCNQKVGVLRGAAV